MHLQLRVNEKIAGNLNECPLSRGVVYADGTEEKCTQSRIGRRPHSTGSFPAKKRLVVPEGLHNTEVSR